MAVLGGGVRHPAGWGRSVASRPCASGGSRGGRGPWRPGAQGRRPLASALSALPSRSPVLGRPLSRVARGGRDRSCGVPGQADEGPAAPAAASRRRVFFGKLRLFLPLSGLRPKGADESPRRARSTLRGTLEGPSSRAPWSETEGDPALLTRELEQGGVEAGIMSLCVHVRS